MRLCVCMLQESQLTWSYCRGRVSLITPHSSTKDSVVRENQKLAQQLQNK